jgi:MATE family multidrug resistance protein
MSFFPNFRRESGALLHLSLPIMLSQIAQVLVGLVDAVMSGHAGASQQAVVALGVALWIPVFVCLMSVVQAVSPLVAHHVGAGDNAAAVREAQEGVMLAAGVGFLPLLLLPWAADLLQAAGIEPALAARTGVFLWGICLGFPAAMVYRALAFYSASIGQVRPVMVLSFLGLGINAALNWVLIYGHLGAPAMGGAGCGWATGIGMWAALLALLAWTRYAPAYKPYHLWRGWHRPQWAAQMRLLRIGLPMGGAGFAEVSAFTSIAVLVGRFGDVQISAHQVALNVSSLTFMLPMGVSAAVTIRVGQALGAGQARRARFIAYSGLATGLLLALLAIGPMIGLRHAVAGAYSDDPAVRDLAANLLLFTAFWQLFDAAQVCAMGALRGYKVTFTPMLMMLGAFWIVGIPVGTWLGYRGLTAGAPMEVYGFWVGLVVGLVLVSVGLVVMLRRVANARLAGGAMP